MSAYTQWKDTEMSPAEAAGLADGIAWDLDGYESWDDVERDHTGWSDATISALGERECRRRWGVEEDDDAAWSRALHDYDRGAHAGATQRGSRAGLPPRKAQA